MSPAASLPPRPALVNRTNVHPDATPATLKTSRIEQGKSKRPSSEHDGRLKKRARLVSEDEESQESSCWESDSESEMEVDNAALDNARQRKGTAFHTMEAFAMGRRCGLRPLCTPTLKSSSLPSRISSSLSASVDATDFGIICFFA
jgi:hypothetical protein